MFTCIIHGHAYLVSTELESRGAEALAAWEKSIREQLYTLAAAASFPKVTISRQIVNALTGEYELAKDGITVGTVDEEIWGDLPAALHHQVIVPGSEAGPASASVTPGRFAAEDVTLLDHELSPDGEE